jgi:diacylglycerol O-acyltransferase
MNQFAPPEAVAMLMMETSERPLHIAVLQLFSPPDGVGRDYVRDQFEAVRNQREVARKWAGHPAPTRRGTSVLRWTYDHDVDLDYHVRFATLPAPGGTRELMELVNQVHSRHLDRRKPLWEVQVIDGLADGRFALYVKCHHALSDGASGSKLLQEALTTDPHDTRIRVGWAPPRDAGKPEAEPPTWGERLGGIGKALGNSGRAVSLIRTGLRDRELLPAMRAPRTIFNGVSSTPLRCAVQSWALHRATDVARKAGVTLNDVALAMCSGALRAYLIERAALPDAPLVALVPVNLRNEDDVDAGTIIGPSLCNLATDVDDPAKRLETIHASMQHNLRVVRELPRELALQLAGVVCAPISGDTGLGKRIPPMVNLTITHMQGSSEPLYWNGARLEGLYPLAPTLRGQALNFGLFSGGGHLDVGIGCSARAVPDPERLLGHVEASLKDLELAVGL